jgi:hypothetical protein
MTGHSLERPLIPGRSWRRAVIGSIREARRAGMPAALADALRDFQDRRFGMFIHWGAYSTLGGRYKGRDVGPDIGEWIMNCLQIPIAEYEEIARGFNPVEFDADAVAGLAARAGMLYVVLTSKHQDGFAMFRSKADRYNVAAWTGTGRDVTGELLAKLKSLTNLRVVRDPTSATGWKIELGPFPGSKHVPTW